MVLPIGYLENSTSSQPRKPLMGNLHRTLKHIFKEKKLKKILKKSIITSLIKKNDFEMSCTICLEYTVILPYGYTASH